jgi:hypothetical protein
MDISTRWKRTKGTRLLSVKGDFLRKVGIKSLPTFTKEPTLAELGITKKESSEAQILASLPREIQEEVIEGELTKAGAHCKAKTNGMEPGESSGGGRDSTIKS